MNLFPFPIRHRLLTGVFTATTAMLIPAPAQVPADLALPDYTRDTAKILPEKTPLIQLALLLDTSSSMDGLINQAKGQLWSMVNAFVQVKKDGKNPLFQVALYEYGRNSLPRETGFTRKVVGFTNDLDELSQNLMALKATQVSGSDERCGHVLHRALQELAWSPVAEDLKVICIAGNESFAQGGIDYRIPCQMAVKNNISTNTIFCGNYASGSSLQWKLGAQLGGGNYSAIDHNVSYRSVSAPQDGELSTLNATLNDTYIPYTDFGLGAKQRQEAADEAAEGLAQSSLSERASLKATRLYQTSDWDLVEACQKSGFDLAAVPEACLPVAMKKMSDAEKRVHLTQQMEKRKAIQKKITALSETRSKYLAKLSSSQANTLDKAVIDSLKAQAEKKKFVLK
jgi:hypothetical protein